MKRESRHRSLGERLAGFARWLAAREELPQSPPRRPRAARAGRLAALLRSEALPPESEPRTSEGGGRLSLSWLLARERLPDPPPRSSEPRVRGVVRRLLSSEQLPEPAAAAESEGEEHDQRH